MPKLRRRVRQWFSIGLFTGSLLITVELTLRSNNGSKLYTPIYSSIKTRMSDNNDSLSEIPIIYVVTPTYARLTQKAELTRLSNTLRLVPNLHWIVIEDSVNKTGLVAHFLLSTQLSFTHLNAKSPVFSKGYPPRGVAPRNAGISWIRENVRTPGVVYFADDDNTYDTRIFEEMRYTKKVSVWPVGLVGGQRFEAPHVRNGTVRGWLVSAMPRRKFGTDMAGFAINVQRIRDNPNAMFRNKRGQIETDLISQLNVTLNDLEPKADNCTQVLVWHTKTSRSRLHYEKNFVNRFKNIPNKPTEV